MHRSRSPRARSLDLREAVLVGHSTGGGEVVRYVGRYGSKRVAKLVLVGAVPPLMLKTSDNPEGLPKEVFDELRAKLTANRSQFYRDFTTPFYGGNREGSRVSDALRDAFWLQSMQGGLKGHLECVKAFSETDFTDDLKKVDVPTLFIHGDDDQIVPIGASARAAVELVRGAKLKVYEAAPHGIPSTHKDQFAADVLAFIASERATRTTSEEVRAPQ